MYEFMVINGIFWFLVLFPGVSSGRGKLKKESNNTVMLLAAAVFAYVLVSFGFLAHYLFGVLQHLVGGVT